MSETNELPPGCTYGEASGDIRGLVYRGSELISTGYTREQACTRAWNFFDDGPDERGALRARIAELEASRNQWAKMAGDAIGREDILEARIAELESERDEARRAAGHYRDGYDDAGPELKVLASNRFPWEASHD